MSATDTTNQNQQKQSSLAETNLTRLSYYHINPSYTLRVICCVLFIFLTEICLAHYIYRLINAEIRDEYVPKSDVQQKFFTFIRSEIGRNEITKLLKEIERDEKASTSSSSPMSMSTSSYNTLIKNNRRKRGALSLDENLLNIANDGPNVEFFNPELRADLEAREDKYRKATGGKGSAPGGDSWVWLTSYSRIPMAALQGFCKATKEYCPPGHPGAPGIPGVHGSKGDRGDTGFPGIPGPMGPRGLPGHPGEKGSQGKPGLDGRDGVPGEPGLDGMPGRNGHDGIPGIDGLPGIPGRDGYNGTHGRTGTLGPQGPPGPTGQLGIPGPRGRTGKPGINGSPGIPGVKAWETKINGSKLLIPPSIAGHTFGTPLGPIIVKEGDNVMLRCGATGIPQPNVIWKKIDGRTTVPVGPWEVSSICGTSLNLTHVNRIHMGLYECIADNGIPPQSNQTFLLEVHFSPLIKIVNSEVRTSIGSMATLECEVEAFPESVRYWEKSGGYLIDNSEKYRIDNSAERDGYRSKMQLNITRINSDDYTDYKCISKNEEGRIEGTIHLKPSGVPRLNGNVVQIIGKPPPERTSLDDLCPPPIACQECPVSKDVKCRENGVSIVDLIGNWEIRPIGNYTHPNNRSTDCVLYAVGKPVYHRYTEQTYGWWMRDPNPQIEKIDGEKYWFTREDDAYHLFYYDNKSLFRKDLHKNYTLTLPFSGNSHVIYNGSFYYNAKDQPFIIRLDLRNETSSRLEVPHLQNHVNSYLYTTNNTYMDFSADDNGLWVIYGIDNNNTAVMKFDGNSMQIQYIWNISLNHHKVGDMFIVCGALYAIDSVTDRNSRIRFAYDLYTHTFLDVNLSFTNPFRRTTMVGYNHRHKELYTWDKGNQLTYPVRYHEMGLNYNNTREEKHEYLDNIHAQMLKTGFDIYPER